MYTNLQLYSLELPPTPCSSGIQQVQAAGLPILPPYTLPKPALTPSMSSRGPVDFIDLPTILSLGETDPCIVLQRVNILERDWSWILQYESEDKHAHIEFPSALSQQRTMMFMPRRCTSFRSTKSPSRAKMASGFTTWTQHLEVVHLQGTRAGAHRDLPTERDPSGQGMSRAVQCAEDTEEI